MSKQAIDLVGLAGDTLWQASQNIENLSHKISNACDTLEILAVETSEDPTSGALWFVRDALKQISDNIYEEADKILSQRQVLVDSKQPAKRKKTK